MVLGKWKKLLSYLWPVVEARKSSILNPNLELRWEHGRLVLNTERANYSYGSLHEVMRVAIDGLSEADMKKLLLLGLGGGSVLTIIRKKQFRNTHVTAVELDPLILDIAAAYFNIGNDHQCTLVQADALDYVQKTGEARFSCIIDDLFTDLVKPDFATNPAYAIALHRILLPDGMLVINVIISGAISLQDFLNPYLSFFRLEQYRLVHSDNHLLFLRRKPS